MTYDKLYREGVNQLAAAGITEADLDARLLLEHICHTNRNDLLAHGEREVSDREQGDYLACISKRAGHTPLQYITGVQEFMGLAFAVDEHVLIPRQDTEILVEEVMRYMHDGMRILDMCTGSGCILLSLLHYANGCTGVGADISGKALEIACKNKETLLLDAEFVESNLFEKIEGKFDIIVANPPYIRSGVMGTLMEEVRCHEPLVSLDGGEDGLFFYRAIISQAPAYLHGGGELFLEIGYDQGRQTAALLAEHGYQGIEIIKDYAGLDRVVHARTLV